MADQVASVFHALIDNVESIVRGKAESIRLALCCLLTEGHLLIDDVPGTGKTSMAKAIAGSIAGSVAASLLLALADTTAKYLVPDYGEFIFYLTVIAIVSLFPNGLLGRPQ